MTARELPANPARCFAAALALCGAIALVGCGDPTPQEQIRSAYNSATEALKAGDGAKFCSELTASGAKAIGEAGKQVTGYGDCNGTMTRMLSAVDALKHSNWSKFCASVNPELAAGIARAAKSKGAGSSCAEAAATLAADPATAVGFANIGKQFDAQFGRMTQSKIDKLTIIGSHASAILKPSQQGDSPLTFQKEPSGWKLDVLQR
jgi:hypothetical protein